MLTRVAPTLTRISKDRSRKPSEFPHFPQQPTTWKSAVKRSPDSKFRNGTDLTQKIVVTFLRTCESSLISRLVETLRGWIHKFRLLHPNVDPDRRILLALTAESWRSRGCQVADDMRCGDTFDQAGIASHVCCI